MSASPQTAVVEFVAKWFNTYLRTSIEKKNRLRVIVEKSPCLIERDWKSSVWAGQSVAHEEEGDEDHSDNGQGQADPASPPALKETV